MTFTKILKQYITSVREFWVSASLGLDTLSSSTNVARASQLNSWWDSCCELKSFTQYHEHWTRAGWTNETGGPVEAYDKKAREQILSFRGGIPQHCDDGEILGSMFVWLLFIQPSGNLGYDGVGSDWSPLRRHGKKHMICLTFNQLDTSFEWSSRMRMTDCFIFSISHFVSDLSLSRDDI